MSSESTLWQMRRGEQRVIERFTSSMRDVYQTRLVELGFGPGTVVMCMAAPSLGAPKLYRVASSVFSLEKDIAVQVTTVEHNG